MSYDQARDAFKTTIEEVAVTGADREEQVLVDLATGLLHLTTAIERDLTVIKAQLHSAGHD